MEMIGVDHPPSALYSILPFRFSRFNLFNVMQRGFKILRNLGEQSEPRFQFSVDFVRENSNSNFRIFARFLMFTKFVLLSLSLAKTLR